jgi:hypothetical protein
MGEGLIDLMCHGADMTGGLKRRGIVGRVGQALGLRLDHRLARLRNRKLVSD